MRLRRCLPLLVITATVAAGCGSDDDERPSSDVGTSTAAVASVPRIYDELQSSVVAVLVEGRRGSGEGSGVVFEPRRIVTNNHVIEGAEKLEVALASGDRLPATVIATDPRTDLAVLGVDRDLPPAEFADRLPDVGAQAIAIGSPLGFEGSVTAGVVSGLDRAIPSGGRTPALVNLLQTDAPISPGNSGGALVGSDGKVIGINVAYIPPAARAVSIGFSIPSPTVVDVVRELLRDGKVDHSYLGAQLGPLTPRVAEALGVEASGGAIIRTIVPDGPAAAAGLRPGDVIVGIAGEPVEQVETILSALRRTDPGTRLEVEIVRSDERRTVDVQLARRPS